MKLSEASDKDINLIEAKKAVEPDDAIPHLSPDHEKYEDYMKIFRRIKKENPSLYHKIINWN